MHSVIIKFLATEGHRTVQCDSVKSVANKFRLIECGIGIELLS
jgi:hypothetical protein